MFAELPAPFYVTFIIAVGTVAALMLTALTVKMMIFPIDTMMMITAVVTRRRRIRICWVVLFSVIAEDCFGTILLIPVTLML
jgi:hypothetical protein